MGCIKHLWHMSSKGRRTSDDAGFRTVAVENVGFDFLDEPTYAQLGFDIIAHGEISDQFGNGNERRVLVHFGDCVAIVVIHSAGSVGDGHIEFAVVDAVDNIHDVTSAAAHGFLDDKQPFPLLHGRAPTPLLFQAF